MRKKVGIVAIGIAFIVTMFVIASAESRNNRIYAEAIVAEQGDEVSVAVKIENNTGFMGYAFVLDYDASIFTPISAHKSEQTQGMFNDSLGASEVGKLKVVYTGTENQLENGTLFTVNFKIKESVSDVYSMKLSYLQDDTFDDEWEEVQMNCEDIRVIVTENGTTRPAVDLTDPSQNETTQTEPDNPKSPSRSQQLKNWYDSLPKWARWFLFVVIRPLILLFAWME